MSIPQDRARKGPEPGCTALAPDEEKASEGLQGARSYFNSSGAATGLKDNVPKASKNPKYRGQEP